MRGVSRNGLMGWVMFGLLALAGVGPASAAAEEETAKVEVASVAQLDDQLEHIRQQVSNNANDDLLLTLRQSALLVQHQADDLATQRTSDVERLDDQLKVLGPAQPDEAQSLASQRQRLTDARGDKVEEQQEATKLTQSAADLSDQISNLRRSLFNSRISTRFASPLSPAFWSSLLTLSGEDLSRITSVGRDASATLSAALSSSSRGLFFASLVVAVLLCSVLRPLAERLLLKAMIRWLPEGRLRRSSLALGTGVVTLVGFAGAVSLAFWGLGRSAPLPASISQLNDQLLTAVVFCAAVTGLGRALLMPSRPSWRLPPIADEVAVALRWFPTVLALALLVVVTQERINSVIASSLALTVATNGLTALVTAVIFAAALWHYRKVRKAHDLERLPGFAGLIPTLVTVWLVLIVLTLLTGYLSLAYFLTGKLLWCSVVGGSAYLITAFYTDLCEALLSPRLPGGMALGSGLGLAERHQAQVSTLLAGVGRSLMVLVALVVALLPSGSSPGELLQGLSEWGVMDKPLGRLDIVPGDILLAVSTFFIGLFVIRVVKRWLSERLLPETELDIGMRASLVTLVGYLGFILLAAIVMSTLHINLSSLTWVVSALSVGIGFGLQAIVQNFISGIILLTERPVKVGDWVSLAGVEGDIRRINVRATEIQMSDRSTVIVPNSQFISQNVRNVTMGNALGVVSISLTLPLDTDVARVRALLLKAYADHPGVLDTPAPSVSLKDVVANGIVISASGYVGSPRSVSGARSDLLFAILEALRVEGVALSAPQSLLMLREQQD